MNFENPNAGNRNDNENNPIENNVVPDARQEEIAYLENTEIRDILEQEGVLGTSEEISLADFEATVSRAKVLLNKLPNITSESALVLAYLDRKTVEKNMDAVAELRSLGNEWLADYVENMFGKDFSEEQYQAFLRFIESGNIQAAYPSEVFLEWGNKRAEHSERVVDMHVVTDEEGRVLSTGETKEEAARKALEKNEE